MITGKVDTREVWNPPARRMAEREWQRMKRRIRAGAATATTSSTWTSPARASGRQMHSTNLASGPTPASTATRGLRNCLT